MPLGLGEVTKNNSKALTVQGQEEREVRVAVDVKGIEPFHVLFHLMRLQVLLLQKVVRYEPVGSYGQAGV